MFEQSVDAGIPAPMICCVPLRVFLILTRRVIQSKSPSFSPPSDDSVHSDYSDTCVTESLYLLPLIGR